MDALVLCLAHMKTAGITVPEHQFLVLFLDFASLAECTLEVDDELVASGLDMFLDSNAVRYELIGGPINDVNRAEQKERLRAHSRILWPFYR